MPLNYDRQPYEAASVVDWDRVSAMESDELQRIGWGILAQPGILEAWREDASTLEEAVFKLVTYPEQSSLI